MENHFPLGAHASLKASSELLYLEGDRPWIRDCLPETLILNDCHITEFKAPGLVRPQTGVHREQNMVVKD